MAKQHLHSFYRPHQRVYAPSQLVNPVTGECYTPEDKTKQSFKDECDINNIIKGYSRSGQWNHVAANAARGMYIDLPDQTDFQQSIQLVKDAEAVFMSIPSHIRDRFGNDPAQFLDWIGNPANKAEATELGFFNKRPVPVPDSATTPPPLPGDKGSAD